MIRAVIAQLVERPTEKPGDAILTRVRIPGAARDFSPSQFPVQTLLRCPYGPLSVCSVTWIYICANIKQPKHWRPSHCLYTQNYDNVYTDTNG